MFYFILFCYQSETNHVEHQPHSFNIYYAIPSWNEHMFN